MQSGVMLFALNHHAYGNNNAKAFWGAPEDKAAYGDEVEENGVSARLQ